MYLDKIVIKTDTDIAKIILESNFYFESLKDEVVVIVSPHPDDDVLGAGGILYRLNKIGAIVYCITCTSGSHAVRDRDIQVLKRFWFEHSEADQYVDNHYTDDYLKEYVRKSETKNAYYSLGISSTRTRFLNLEFYNNKTSDYKSDIKKMIDCLEDLRPTVLLVESGFGDPNETHQKCYAIVQNALEHISFNPNIVLYRSVWKSFSEEEATLIFPFSKEVAEIKKNSILCHASQLFPMFPGGDTSEFFQRAEQGDRNRGMKVNYRTDRNYAGAEYFVEVDKLPIALNFNIT